MSKTWTPERRAKFMETMKKRYPHGTRFNQGKLPPKQPRKATRRTELLQRMHQMKEDEAKSGGKFELPMVQFKPKAPKNGSGLTQGLALLRAERFNMGQRVTILDTVIQSLESLTQEQK